MFENKGTKKAISVLLTGVLAVSMVAPGFAFADDNNNQQQQQQNQNNNQQQQNQNNNNQQQQNPGDDFENVEWEDIYKLSPSLSKEEAGYVKDHTDGINNKEKEISDIEQNIYESNERYQPLKDRFDSNVARYNEVKNELSRLRQQIYKTDDIESLNRQITALENEYKQLVKNINNDKSDVMMLKRHLELLNTQKSVKMDELHALIGDKKFQELVQKAEDVLKCKTLMKKINPKLTEKEINDIMKYSIQKNPKTWYQKVKASVLNQFDIKTIATRAVSTIVMKFAKGAIIDGVKSVCGINIVGKTYSYAELANLVNSIDSSVDIIQENIKVAKDEFSDMVAENAYRDFVECVTRLKQSLSTIKSIQETAIVWGKYRAGENCEDKDLINKYTNEAFAEFFQGRFDYIDALIADYVEFKNRLTAPFTNNGKNAIDLVDEYSDKLNDIFQMTYQRKVNFRSSLSTLALSSTVLIEYVSKVNDDFAIKYTNAAENLRDTLNEIYDLQNNKSIGKKYGLRTDSKGEVLKEELEKTYLSSKKSYAQSAEFLSRDTKDWTQLSGKISNSSRTTGPDPVDNVVIAPFRSMVASYLWGCTNHIVGFYIEDFKNSDSPAYKKWEDAYLGKEDVAKLLANKPANMSIRDYLTKTVGLKIDNQGRYFVVGCSMDYTYHRYCNDDFEMRLSYFDIETGKYYQNQVVAKGDIESDSAIWSASGWDWRSNESLNPFVNDDTDIEFRGILAGNDGIFAIPFWK